MTTPTICCADFKDLPSLCALFDEARGTIAELGIDQWQNGYPDEKTIMEDLAKGRIYAVKHGEALYGTFALIHDGEPTYDEIVQVRWLTGA